MHILRAPGGCPWDAEQTHESLAPYLVEEAYEVAAAVKSGDQQELIDELGDVLLQPVFHAEVASESEDGFDLDDIAHSICEKLIRRHPHVFGDSEVNDPGAVISQWEKIKASEKGGEAAANTLTMSDSILKSANEGVPSLMAAHKIQSKVAKVGFDWPSVEPVLDKIKEETAEVEEAMAEGTEEDVAEEIGDLLFAVVNLARKSGFQAELLLDATNRKFVDRFRQVESQLASEGKDLKEASLEEMDAAWEAAKN